METSNAEVAPTNDSEGRKRNSAVTTNIKQNTTNKGFFRGRRMK